MRNRTWLFLALYGLFLASAVSAALKNTRPKFKIATTWTTPSTTTDKSSSQAENETESENDDSSKVEATTVAGDLNATTGHTLTGIPQIDYIWDPNLPRELNGYNLSDYPFYNSIPEEIDFKCDGLHDGFYASVPHKCQVYHHCLFGTRYDFLCANFTAFDQKTFICHFVSEVDCVNSKKYWHRNDALYQATTTTTIAPPTTTTTTARTTTSQAPPQPFPQGPRSIPRRRRPFRRRPAYDYYEDYYDDDYERPRSRGSGYDRREEYDYDDQQYTRRNNRERDRDHYREHFRDHDRDYRDKDLTRPREYTSERSAVKDDQDAVIRPRDRFPSRNNRRDPSRQEQGDNERENDGRNYQDQRYDRGYVRDDYDDQESVAPSNEGLVKPSAPISSVYARPRTPPKIRRPVPLSEQEKYAYKATTPQTIAEESHRRPTETMLSREQDYYDDQLEDIRPRRPLRRRPFRERERLAYDHPREIRERDRPYRPRFREDEEEMRPRKYPERPRDRDRYYERNRDRALLDHEKDSVSERIIPEREREQRPALRRPSNREKENDRPLVQLPTLRDIPEESEDASNRATNPLNKDSETTTSKMVQNNSNQDDNNDEDDDYDRVNDDKQVRNNKKEQETHGTDEEYSSADEYYDEPEYSSSPSSPSSSAPPKTAVRIIKRPFLPSRGGNPNPRGLSTVGIKAPEYNKKHNASVKPEVKLTNSNKEYSRASVKAVESYTPKSQEPKVYDAYKAIENDKHYKKVDFDEQLRRPAESSNTNAELDTNLRANSGSGLDKWKTHEEKSEIKPSIPWNGEELRRRPSQVLPNRGSSRYSTVDNSSYTNYQATYTTKPNRQEITGPSNPVTKQKINEVPHRLQDIPESEYDVTLNEALTPAFNQDTNLPSGFVLPYNQHNRHLNREPVLEPSENNYRISRPYNTQSDPSQQHHQQQKSFVPSTHFFPSPRIANNDERSGSIQYFKTPEVVHIAGSGYNRQSGRNSWHDYTGYQ
ncbi:zinc finger CCCH domain-containing protein 13 isoform X2 [Chelonus insularis]|uniref:zinc finger CCCH domain-containing protein 13 isoform X2 n=1 Tax=Chelonus insularis TaxID=460826 RepID=UPI00158C6CAC|nr:zinc finger CCCH domain-containing protein 13-like isoform X2 [Chelonus insularis]